jgi:DNA recombination protein RmuC
MQPEQLIFFMAVVIAVLGFLLWRRSGSSSNSEKLILQLLQNQEEKLRDQNTLLQSHLQVSQTGLHKQFELTQQLLQETNKSTLAVSNSLLEMGQTNKQILGFAGQLQSLEKVLRNPKQRGILGEYLLEVVLKNVLPPDAFALQYRLSDGVIVDAVIKLRDQLIPIDAKFSLDNYQKMVEAIEQGDDKAHQEYARIFAQDMIKRIDETSKYINPKAKTLEFAFMFVPADGIYYDLLTNVRLNAAGKNVIEYGFGKKVIIVSPTTLFAYLQTVLQGLRALQIEKSAHEIQQKLGTLAGRVKSHGQELQKLGSHLQHAKSSFDKSQASLNTLEGEVFYLAETQLPIANEADEQPE